MNRAQRRAQMKQVPAYMRGSNEVKIALLMKQGISPDDLEKEYRDGYDAGFRAGGEYTLKTVYAAVCLALNKEFGFGRERAARVLCAADRIVCETIASPEAIEEVFDKMHLRIAFKEPFDRVEAVK